MTKKEFLLQLEAYFLSKGFLRKKDHFYRKIADDLLLVIGIQQSYYGAYGYLEYGLAIPSINKSMPYPKFNQLDINCGRVMTSRGKKITWEEIDSEFQEDIQKTLDARIENMILLSKLDKRSLVQHFQSGLVSVSWYILGDNTAAYFGLTRKDFQGHFCEDE